MIEVTCNACSKTLGSFATQAAYIAWREGQRDCECGAALATTLSTRYIKESGETKKKEVAGDKRKPDILVGSPSTGRKLWK